MVDKIKKGFKSLKVSIRRLQNNLTHGSGVESESEEEEAVPCDVEEGQFAILAADKEEERAVRFVLELSVLKDPEFLRLLSLAEEEYGFQQKGAIAVPCGPEQVRKFLRDGLWKRTHDGYRD